MKGEDGAGGEWRGVGRGGGGSGGGRRRWRVWCRVGWVAVGGVGGGDG